MTEKKLKKIHRRISKDVYPARALAVVVGGIMFLEGLLFGVATADHVKSAVNILDISEDVQVLQADMTMLAQPFVVTIKGIHKFYQESAQETAYLLENNLVTYGSSLVSDIGVFYKSATKELTLMLDLSDWLYPGGL